MKQPFETARDVSEYLLETAGLSLLAGDDSGVTAFFSLPQDVQTFTGQRTITSEDELRKLFRAVSNYYRKLGVTDIVQQCLEASFKSPDTVFAAFETRLLRGNTMVQEPYPVFCILKCDGGTWKVASSSYAIKDRPDHNAALMSAGTCVQPKTSA